MEMAERILKKLDEQGKKLDEHDSRFARLETAVDKIVVAVIDIRSDVRDLKDRVGSLETKVERIVNTLDGFLVLVNRHEAEIASLRMANARLEDRIAALERQRA